MREIKFRAWNPTEKKMWQNIGVCDSLIILETNNMGLKYMKNQEDATSMQFTCLLDKNGKEIYEGDIVDCSTKFLKHILEVYWDKRGYQYRLRVNGEMQYDKTYMIDIAKFGEVIGNIYEHESLLKGER